MLEEEFTILHEGETTPAIEAHVALQTELVRYKDHEREFGKAGHADFGLWELWAERRHVLGALFSGGTELLTGDVIVSGFDAATTRHLADAWDELTDDELTELFFSSELRKFADYTTVERGSRHAAEEVEMFLEELAGPRAVFTYCRANNLGLIISVG